MAYTLEELQKLGATPVGNSTEVKSSFTYDELIKSKATPISTDNRIDILAPAKQSLKDLGTLYSGSDQGIAKRLIRDVKEGASDVSTGIQEGDVGKVIKGYTKSGFRVAGDVAGAVFAPVGALLGATGINHVFDYIGELSQKGKYNPINLITDSKELQNFVTTHPNLEEDFVRALNIAFAKAERGQIEPNTVIPRTIEQFKTGVDNVTSIPGKVIDNIKSPFQKAPEDIVNKRVSELEKISDNYSALRKQKDFNPEAAKESVKRVAETDVLANAVDENGLIRTKQPGGAVDQYEAQTIGHAEDVVRRNLVRLNETVTPEEIKIRLEDAVNKSGLEGADLKVALKKVDREVEGYKLKANENGEIPLYVLHDAKIGTAAKIRDFATPADIKTYEKSLRGGLQTLVEKNSKFNVGEVNGELSKYLRDIEFLESLDGRKVEGGRLGKYFSQITGNIVGGTVGSIIGGPVGGAAGTIVGGEIARGIKGRQFKNTFSGETGFVPEKNPIIEKAAQQAEGIPTKSEQRKIESSKVEPKKGLLQTAAEKYKQIPSKEGGFVKIGGKEFREITEATKREMVLIVDYLNLKQEVNKNKEQMLDYLNEKYNINPEWSNSKIADTYVKLIENTKTR